jgi:hypothetical protein
MSVLAVRKFGEEQTEGEAWLEWASSSAGSLRKLVSWHVVQRKERVGRVGLLIVLNRGNFSVCHGETTPPASAWFRYFLYGCPFLLGRNLALVGETFVPRSCTSL